MSLQDVARSVVHRVGALGPVRDLRERLYRREFARTAQWKGLHLGVFDSFAQARAAAPVGGHPVGYALDDDWFAAGAVRICSHDYPILYWLAPLMPSVKVLFDYGGHVGVHYVAYRPHLTYAPTLRWIVGEQPEVAAKGAQLCREKGLTQIEFVTDFSGAEGADVLLSAGCIHFVETPFISQLAAVKRRPRHVLLNKVPIYDKETRVTLQNTGRSFSPCWIYNRAELVASMTALGYELVDQWDCPERSLHIPFHADYSVQRYSGLYFRATGPADAQ